MSHLEVIRILSEHPEVRRAVEERRKRGILKRKAGGKVDLDDIMASAHAARFLRSKREEVEAAAAAKRRKEEAELTEEEALDAIIAAAPILTEEVSP